MNLTTKQQNYIIKLDPSRTIESIKDLTVQEASKLIRALIKEQNITNKEPQQNIFNFETFKNLFWKSQYSYYKKEEEFKDTFKYSLELNGLWLTLDNPKIKTDFCFPDDYDTPEEQISIDQCRRARTDTEYFIRENLEQVDEWIETLENDRYVFTLQSHYNDGRLISIIPCNFNGTRDNPKVVWGYCDNKLTQGEDYIRIMTEEEQQKVLSAYKQIKEDFKKRLNAYLKRYGLSKIRAWTYWAGR